MKLHCINCGKEFEQDIQANELNEEIPEMVLPFWKVRFCSQDCRNEMGDKIKTELNG